MKNSNFETQSKSEIQIFKTWVGRIIA